MEWNSERRTWHWMPVSERRFVARRPRGCAFGQGQAGDDVKVQDVIAVYEHNLAAFRSVEGVAEPVTGCLGDLATCNDERVVDQRPTVGFGMRER